jgi:hypothetical protein
MTNCVLDEEGHCHPQQKDSHPLPKTPPNMPAILYGVGGVGLVCRSSSRTPTLLGAAIKGMEDEENANEGKKEVEMESEEMGGLTSLLVGVVCQKPYEEPDERLSAALFLLGSAINDADDDQDDLVSAPNKMEIARRSRQQKKQQSTGVSKRETTGTMGWTRPGAQRKRARRGGSSKDRRESDKDDGAKGHG